MADRYHTPDGWTVEILQLARQRHWQAQHLRDAAADTSSAVNRPFGPARLRCDMNNGGAMR